MSASVFSFSIDYQYLVYASPSGIIKIWETSTGKLKQEYIPSSHLSATCCCISWCPWSIQNSSKVKKKIGKSPITQTHKPDVIALGTSTGSILLYSYVKGDLHSQLVDGHTDRLTGFTWADDDSTLFSSSYDHHIVQWDIPSASIKHKWKAGNSPVHSLCWCNPNHLATAARSIKIWDLDTYAVLKTFTGHTTEVMSLLHYTNKKTIDDSYLISAALDDRLINIWHIQLGTKHKAAAAGFTLPDTPVMLSLSQKQSTSQTVNLVILTKSGQVLFYESALNGRLKKTFKALFSIYCASPSAIDNVPIPVPIHAATGSADQVIVMSGSLLKPSFDLVSRKSDGSDICLIKNVSVIASSTVNEKSSTGKVKTPHTSDNVTALAPGFMAPVLPSATGKEGKTKRKAFTSEMSLGERLNAIGIDDPHIEDVTNPPRADTLAVLLSQGLQSNDKNILNNVLQTSNETVIRNTVRRLSVHSVLPLVKELSQRMHGHAQSGMVLSRWLKFVLSSHTSYLMSIPEIVDVCASVYQMMDCRVNMYTRLSKLQGRLDLLLSQISDQGQATDDLSKQQPLLIYHEESSDDEMLEDIIHPHSESEENWSDLSEDDMEDDEDEDMESSKDHVIKTDDG